MLFRYQIKYEAYIPPHTYYFFIYYFVEENINIYFSTGSWDRDDGMQKIPLAGLSFVTLYFS